MLPLLVDGVEQIHMLLHNSHHVSVHQPGRCCEASLQCVSPLYSFSDSAAPPVLVSLVHLTHHQRVLAFTVALIYTLSKCLWMQVASHLQWPKTLYLLVATTHQSMPFKSEVWCCHQSNKRVATYQVRLRVFKDFLV